MLFQGDQEHLNTQNKERLTFLSNEAI